MDPKGKRRSSRVPTGRWRHWLVAGGIGAWGCSVYDATLGVGSGDSGTLASGGAGGDAFTTTSTVTAAGQGGAAGDAIVDASGGASGSTGGSAGALGGGGAAGSTGGGGATAGGAGVGGTGGSSDASMPTCPTCRQGLLLYWKFDE